MFAKWPILAEKASLRRVNARLVESLRAARLRLFDTPTADILRRLFGERRLVNGAPQRRDETTGRDFESDGQEAELGRAGRKPRLHSAELEKLEAATRR